MANEYVFEDEHFTPKFSASFVYRGLEEVWVGDGDSETREDYNDYGYLYAKYQDGRIVCIGQTAPESAESIEAAKKAAQDAESSATLAESYKSEAERQAELAEQSKESATEQARQSRLQANSAAVSSQIASSMENYATQERYKSEGYARGTQDGVEVGQDSPYYQSNAKYYYDIIFERGTEEIVTPAQAAAQAAANSASAAANSASAAAVHKQDAQDASEAASSSAQSASSNASATQNSLLRAEAMRYESEGYACGTQDGVDADSSSPYYHNNAKYYYDMIAQSGGIPITIHDLYEYFNWDSYLLEAPMSRQIVVYVVGPFLIGFVDLKMRDDVQGEVSDTVQFYSNYHDLFNIDTNRSVTIPIIAWTDSTTAHQQIGVATFTFERSGSIIDLSISREALPNGYSGTVSAYIRGFFVLPLAYNS